MSEADDEVLGGDPGDEWEDDVDGAPLRGWIPPDDRLWRHPSESGSHRVVVGLPPSRPATAVRISPWVLGSAATCVVLALVAVALVMTTTGGDDVDGTSRQALRMGTPTTEASLQRASTTEEDGAAAVAAVRPSTVVMRVGRASGTQTSIAMVVESGGIVVTPWTAVAGARSVTAIEQDGTRSEATLVGVDHRSGLAVLQVSDDLPVATFGNSDPSTGSTALAVSMALGDHGVDRPAPEVYAGDVVSSGQPTGTEPAGSFAVTELAAPLTAVDVGCPLVDGRGDVVGMLAETTGSGSSTMSVFLPAGLVLGVARQLVSAGTVEPGWLGATASDASPSPAGGSNRQGAGGAQLNSITNGGPAAAAGLVPGEVVTAVDGTPVRTGAELATQLYPDPPGTSVELAVEIDGAARTVAVQLGEGQGADPATVSSP